MPKGAPKPKKRTAVEATAADAKAGLVGTRYRRDDGETVTVVTCRQCNGKGGACCNGFGFLRQGELAL
jgi:hypothetical protein